jgi:deoxyribose-phosphate aldolase
MTHKLPTIASLAKMIDHSLLHPTMTDAMIDEGLALSRRFEVATACVKPYSVSRAKAMLDGSGVGVCAVVGFPHGNSTSALKVAETVQAIHDGATEIDMVANAGKVLGGDWGYVKSEMRAINMACVDNGAILKVIFENDYLQHEPIIRLCVLCTELEIAFVKTSSGYGFVKQPGGNYNYNGATDVHLQLMRQHCGPKVQIKAAGGVRTLDDLLKVRGFGVTRIGATATESMLREAVARGFPAPVPPALLSEGTDSVSADVTSVY